MKHIVRDLELVAYLEGTLSKDEVRQLKERMEENGELDLLYHLQLSYEKGMKEYAAELIGEDECIESGGTFSLRDLERAGIRIAADIRFPEEEK